jgi:hypothetical protein
MEPEVRKLPKKTIIIMIILGILGVVWFFLVAYGQSAKVEKILHMLNYKNVSDVKVYAYHKFLREDINTEGFKYTVSFIDNDKKEYCKGFVLKDFKQNVTKDLICKKLGE